LAAPSTPEGRLNVETDRLSRIRDVVVIIAALLVTMFMVSELGYVDLAVGEEPSA
jgi:hypothetical protein